MTNHQGVIAQALWMTMLISQCFYVAAISLPAGNTGASLDNNINTFDFDFDSIPQLGDTVIDGPSVDESSDLMNVPLNISDNILRGARRGLEKRSGGEVLHFSTNNVSSAFGNGSVIYSLPIEADIQKQLYAYAFGNATKMKGKRTSEPFAVYSYPWSLTFLSSRGSLPYDTISYFSQRLLWETTNSTWGTWTFAGRIDYHNVSVADVITLPVGPYSNQPLTRSSNRTVAPDADGNLRVQYMGTEGVINRTERYDPKALIGYQYAINGSNTAQVHPRDNNPVRMGPFELAKKAEKAFLRTFGMAVTAFIPTDENVDARRTRVDKIIALIKGAITHMEAQLNEAISSQRHGRSIWGDEPLDPANYRQRGYVESQLRMGQELLILNFQLGVDSEGNKIQGADQTLGIEEWRSVLEGLVTWYKETFEEKAFP